MSNEIKNSSSNFPRAMITDICITASHESGMLVAISFLVGQAGPIHPHRLFNIWLWRKAIFLQVTGFLSGCCATVDVLIILGACTTIAFVASLSTMYWSLACDCGLPFANYLGIVYIPLDPALQLLILHVESRKSISSFALLLTTISACLLALISIGSSVTFNNVISLSISGLYSTYLI